MIFHRDGTCSVELKTWAGDGEFDEESGVDILLLPVWQPLRRLVKDRGTRRLRSGHEKPGLGAQLRGLEPAKEENHHEESFSSK